jgi:hypothetical protein
VAQDRHSEKYQNNKFCGRVPCDHHDYIKICNPGWPNPSLWQYAQRKKGGAITRTYEAHHILCWSPVANVLLTPDAQPLLKDTEWCINNAKNMMALPLWGHTVKWYALTGELAAPAFSSLPQHNFDHNCKAGYTAEVVDELKQIVKNLQNKQKQHQLPDSKTIAGLLDAKSAKFKALLLARGSRVRGTHLGWRYGESVPLWYLPFSMASDGAAKPRIFSEKKKSRLDAIIAAQKLLSGS